MSLFLPLIYSTHPFTYVSFPSPIKKPKPAFTQVYSQSFHLHLQYLCFCSCLFFGSSCSPHGRQEEGRLPMILLVISIPLSPSPLLLPLICAPPPDNLHTLTRIQRFWLRIYPGEERDNTGWSDKSCSTHHTSHWTLVGMASICRR